MAVKFYTIQPTDASANPIRVNRRVLITELVDITLIGKRIPEYGLEFNENVLHLLEHFACPSLPSELNVPDTFNKLGETLRFPIVGQCWYSTNTSTVFVWNGSEWIDIRFFQTISGNYGFITDGERVPLPENMYGIVNDMNNCACVVSPVIMIADNSEVEHVTCEVDNTGLVKCKYTVDGMVLPGIAHYAIVCDSDCTLVP